MRALLRLCSLRRPNVLSPAAYPRSTMALLTITETYTLISIKICEQICEKGKLTVQNALFQTGSRTQANV